MKLSEKTKETIINCLAWLLAIAGGAMAAFALWLTLWLGYDAGLKM